MIEFTKQWIINIVALVLFIIMFEILLPTGKMKKYVNLVTGTILIIAIISPLTEVLGKNFDISAFQVSDSNQLDRLQIEKDSKLLQKEQTKQIVEVYRNKIIGQLEQSAEEVKGVKSAKADVIINEDTESKNFGEIKRTYLEIEVDAPVSSGESKNATGAAVSEEISSVEPVKQVEKVIIGSKDAALKGHPENCDPLIKKALEEKISGIFGVSSDNIIISQSKR